MDLNFAMFNGIWSVSVRTFGVIYDHTFSMLADHQIRHKATHKMGCQLGDCTWLFNLPWGLCGCVWVNTHFMDSLYELHGSAQRWVNCTCETSAWHMDVIFVHFQSNLAMDGLHWSFSHPRQMQQREFCVSWRSGIPVEKIKKFAKLFSWYTYLLYSPQYKVTV